MDGRTLKATLHEQMEAKSMTAAKLAGITGVPERFIDAIVDGNPEKLPAPPYVKGYLSKIGAALNLDGDALWEIYSQEHSLRRSGSGDTLPKNRFAMKAISKTKIFLVFFVFALVVYLGFQAKNFLGVPELKITNPSSVETTITSEPSIIVSGNIDRRDKLFINGENAVPDQEGNAFSNGSHTQQR